MRKYKIVYLDHCSEKLSTFIDAHSFSDAVDEFLKREIHSDLISVIQMKRIGADRAIQKTSWVAIVS